MSHYKYRSRRPVCEICNLRRPDVFVPTVFFNSNKSKQCSRSVCDMCRVLLCSVREEDVPKFAKPTYDPAYFSREFPGQEHSSQVFQVRYHVKDDDEQQHVKFLVAKNKSVLGWSVDWHKLVACVKSLDANHRLDKVRELLIKIDCEKETGVTFIHGALDNEPTYSLDPTQQREVFAGYKRKLDEIFEVLGPRVVDGE